MLLNPLLAVFLQLLIPAFLLALAYFFTGAVSELGDMQVGVLKGLPALIGCIGIFMALRFSRIRLGAAMINLLVGYVAIIWALQSLDAVPASIALGLAAILLPLNHLACHLLPERASVTKLNGGILAVLAGELVLVLLAARFGGEGLQELLETDFLRFIDRSEFGAQDAGFAAGLIMLTLSFARLYQHVNTQRAALFMAGFSLFLVLGQINYLHYVIPYATAAVLLLTVAAFQETWNIAYLDPLTGLPARRALDEALARLDGQYAIAMMDVDHFKKFNDSWGHDVGDQVLKMVASRLAEVSGSGKAFRYGGEEFTLLFPGKTAREAKPEVDRLRELIAEDTFEIRRHDRRNDGNGSSRRTAAPTINITISGGLAERKQRRQPAEDVIKAADEALYKSKQAGRNCVTISRRRG